MAGGSTTSIDDLVQLIDVDARRALRLALDRSHRTSSDAEAARLAWVSGLAHRELGDLTAARDALERATSLAESSGERALQARVAISLAYEIGHTGELRAALGLLASIAPDVAEGDRARLANQRGTLHYRLGMRDDAVADFEEAQRTAAANGDTGTALRALVNLGAIHSQRGAHADARRVLVAAIAMASDAEEGLAALALQNLAYVETAEGNLPEALDCFAAAEDGYRRVGSLGDLPRLHADHALALADANLLGDAESLIDRAIALSSASGDDVELAELLLVSAEIDLALGKPDETHVAAVEASARLAEQGRENWRHIAERLRLRAEAQLHPDDPAVADGMVENGRALAAGGWRSEALAAGLLAALLHARSGRHEQAASLLVDLGREATHSRATHQILLGHVLALLAEARGDRAAARRAVTGGLRVAAATQAALGSLETRSHAAQHGADLIELGARLAVADGRPRELLHRIEAMRTMVSHAPLVRAPDDEAMAGQLTELRRLSALIADPDASMDERRRAERDRLGLERAIRGLARRARGERTTRGRNAARTEDAVADAVADLRAFGDRQALAYANLDGRLLAVAVDRGRCRLHDLGPADSLGTVIDDCGFVLHRLNRRQGSHGARVAALAALQESAATLGELLLPSQITRSDRPLLVVPTGVLHGVPWMALDQLRGRAVSVSPSLTGWSVAARAATSRAGRRLESGLDPGEPAGLIAGPGLAFAEAEVTAAASVHHRSTVLTGDDATAAACLRLLGDCELVHLACHGSFRTDNPLFSMLSLADGPLTVYDLERVRQMPGTVVLSACSAGSSTALNGGTLLGFSSALGTFGASSVIAPLTPVNDERVVSVMRRLHEGLAGGLDPALALAAVADDGHGLDPAAAAFVAIGA